MTGWRKRQIGEHMTKDETLKLALEALETAEIDGNCEYGATEIIRKALAQPEQRTWVGLTNNELQPIADEYRILFGSWVEDFARAIEAKLKEKNT
jgi:hypothetical protein